MRLPFACLVFALLAAGCAAPEDEPVVPALLVGEQHDAAEHQQLHRDLIDALANRGVLGAVVIEMAEQGHSTANLPADASEEDVKRALAWRTAGGWPWERYGPAVMSAVRARVPVFGGNIGDSEMRGARSDASLDALVPPSAFRTTQENIRAGHCGLLPESQLVPMARIQLARDHAMARAVEAAARPGKTVVLLAGAGHVDPELGVPLHLPARLHAKSVELPAVDTGIDYCAELRKQLAPSH